MRLRDFAAVALVLSSLGCSLAATPKIDFAHATPEEAHAVATLPERLARREATLFDLLRYIQVNYPVLVRYSVTEQDFSQDHLVRFHAIGEVTTDVSEELVAVRVDAEQSR